MTDAVTCSKFGLAIRSVYSRKRTTFTQALSLVKIQRTTGINFANSLGLLKMLFSKLTASYISPVSVSFVLFLLYVSCFGYFFASCYVVLICIHHHLRAQDQYLRQKDKSKAERCFRVESAKLCALRAKNELACQRALHAYVLTCQCVLHVYMLTCQRTLRAYVLSCQHALRAYVLMCQRALRANVPCVLTCSRANLSCVLTCLVCLHAHVKTSYPQ